MRAPALAGRLGARMNLAQRVLWATAIQVAGRAVALLLALVSVRLATNYLGLDQYGEFAIVLAVSTLVFVLSDFGLSLLLARELAKAPERADELGGTLLGLRFALSGAALVVALAVVPFLPYDGNVKVGLAIALAGVFVGTVSLFPLPFFQVHLRLEYVALSDLTVKALTLVLMAGVVLLDLGFYPLIATIALAWLGNLALTFGLSRRYWRINVRRNPALTREMAKAVWPIGLVAVLGLLHFKADALMLSVMKPAADVGIYNVAYSFLEQSLVLPTLFMAAVFPILTRYVHARDPLSHEVIEKSFRFLMLLAVPLTAALFVLATPLVRLVSSSSFDDAATPLRILSFTVLVAFGNVVFAQLLIILDRLREVALASLFALAVNIGTNLYFIPKYTYVGAAGTTIGSECLGFVLIFLLARRAYGVRLGASSLARLTASAGVTALVVWATLGYPRWVAALLAAAAFAVAALALRVVTRDDLALILARAERREKPA